MSATAIILLKIMPDSPQANLGDIHHEVKKFMEKHGARGLILEEQEIAFGLKAITAKAAIPEEKGTDLFETGLAAIPHVSSVSVEDYRRAFG